jgi:CDGSH-type Zn-finger protein
MTERDSPSALPVIVACTDGPLLVRGNVDLVSASGEPIPRTRSTVALCRCGVSTIKPFCDGTHKLIGFKTDPLPPAV